MAVSQSELRNGRAWPQGEGSHPATQLLSPGLNWGCVGAIVISHQKNCIE